MITVPRKLADVALLTPNEIDNAALCGNSDLILPSEKFSELRPILIVYVGARATSYGENAEADLVKIHFGYGKVTFLAYDDFSARVLQLAELLVTSITLMRATSLYCINLSTSNMITSTTTNKKVLILVLKR